MSFSESLQKIKSHFNEELRGMRTGRASTGLVSGIEVEAYGSKMPIEQIASVNVVDAAMVTIEPWDKSLIQSIEKAILSSDKAISPAVDGNIIRVSVPQMTEESRKQIVKNLNEKLEVARVSIRKAREDEKKKIEKQKKEGDISEDSERDSLKKLDQDTKSAIEDLESLAEKKENEIMTL